VTALLDVSELSVSYGPVAAVHGISFHVDEGELVAVVGPNGAGKTTTLACLAGLRRRRAGEVSFRGEAVDGKNPEELVRQGMALVPEGRHIFGSLSVRENLEVGASSRRADDSVQADVEWVLEVFPALRELLRRPAGQLSGGEQQQLAISRALMARPRLLMLDEPSLGLAPRIVAQIFGLVRRLVDAEGLSVLLVEQNARSALTVADTGVVLNLGRVVTTADARSLLADEGLRHAYLGF
jgi:branched-chain amino acid transport system ATP-binding protein